MPMSPTLQSWLEKHGVIYDLHPHPRTMSSRETAEAAHVPPDHIAKAVIVRDNEGFAMVVIPGSDWLRLQALQEEAGREFGLADESDIDRLFDDCEPGAIPPMGPARGLETFVDEKLLSLANVYFEAGDHRQLVHVRGEDFHNLLKGARHGHFSHDD